MKATVEYGLHVTGCAATARQIIQALDGRAPTGAGVVCWPRPESEGVDVNSVLAVHHSVMAGLAATKDLALLDPDTIKHIALVSDTGTSTPGPAMAVVEASMAAFGKSLAREIARTGRTVNTTSVDVTDSESARQIRFLTGETASFVTGQSLGRAGRRIAPPAPTPQWTLPTGGWILVSGGAGAIGEAIVRALHANGTRILIGHVREGLAQTLARELDPTGETCQTVHLDMSDADLPEQAASLCARYPDLVGMVICGGWNLTHPFVDTAHDEWEKTLQINFTGAAVFSAALVAAGGNRHWSFVGIGSESSRIGDAGRAVYAAGKAALASFLSCLAHEVPTVHAVTVAPGPVDTPLLRATHADAAAAEKGISRLERLVPLGRLGKPEEIAAAVAYVLSAEGMSFNGELISVGGGITMQ
jgi:2-hydroxycyclohexanecarboxyl-CoA dehydrogenase